MFIVDARALVRLQCDHVNRSLVPAFYRYLQAQEEQAILSGAKEFMESLYGLTALLQRAEREVSDGSACGLWNEGGKLSLTDVMAGPCMSLMKAIVMMDKLIILFFLLEGLFRATNVLKHYKGFEIPPSEQFSAWLNRLFGHPSFKSTCSTEDLYLDSYER